MDPLTGTLFGFAGVIVTAVVGLVGVIVARKMRGPVSVQDLWTRTTAMGTEIATLQTQVKTLLTERETQFAVVRLIGDGFDVYDARAATFPPIEWTPRELEAIERARALRRDDDFWTTLQRMGPVQPT